MKILTSEIAQHYQISSLQRGHLIFSSFISVNGKILFLDSHLERLVKGADFLFPNLGWPQNSQKIKNYVLQYFQEINDHSFTNFYFRLTLFDDSLYLQHRRSEVFSDSINLTTAVKIKTPSLIPEYVKFSNYVESDIEIVRARFKNFDDIVYLDNSQHITEASTSNIFIVNNNGVIKTPKPSSMILDGIVRKQLLCFLQKENFQILEAPIAIEEFKMASEIWLTNSVKGIRFVDQFDNIKYSKKNSVFERVSLLCGRYGELL